MKLLVVEDNRQLAATLRTTLKKLYEVDLAFTGDKGEYLAFLNEYDLILLDLNLPDMDGTDVCRKIREDGKATPILALTGRTALTDRVRTLDTGADDYLTKPFEFEELFARIRSLLRRSTTSVFIPTKLVVADLTFDLSSQEIIRAERYIDLRKKERELLEYLLRNQGKLVSRDQILEHVWQSETDPLTNTVDVHINKLRRKICYPFKSRLIKTVHGMGYVLQSPKGLSNN